MRPIACNKFNCDNISAATRAVGAGTEVQTKTSRAAPLPTPPRISRTVPAGVVHLTRQSKPYQFMGGRDRDVRRLRRSRRCRHRARLLLLHLLRRRRPRTAREVHASEGNTIHGSLRVLERVVSRFNHGRSSGRGVGIDDRDKSGQGEDEGGGIRLLMRRIMDEC